MAKHTGLKEVLKLTSLGLWLSFNKSLLGSSAFPSTSSFSLQKKIVGSMRSNIGKKVFWRTLLHSESFRLRNGVSHPLFSSDLERSGRKMKLNQSKKFQHQNGDDHGTLREITNVPDMKLFSQNDSVIKASSLLSDDNYDYLKTQFLNQGDVPEIESDVKNFLVCGDGDLSYSASIAPKLAEMDIQLIATVLESEEAHQSVYENSQINRKTIESFKFNKIHKVLFGIDATDLKTCLKTLRNYPNEKIDFDRIQFNFPHWKGKSNHKYNRALLNNFLCSASEVLSKNGQIHIALCEGQGGTTASSLDEWRQSWKASTYAAEHGLILTSVIPFKPLYDLSSHRGIDRPFKVGRVPEMYIFMKDNVLGRKINKDFQLCCSHELHTLLPDQNSIEGLSCETIQNIIQDFLPNGIIAEVPICNIIKKEKTGAEIDMAVYLIVYRGESKAITRNQADIFRAQTENILLDYVFLRENRRDRLVSKPYPYPLLDSMIKKIS